MAEVEFKKIEQASRSYGRGVDSYYAAAVYQILLDGKEIGRIKAEPRHYMEPASWEIVETGNWNIGRRLFPTVKAAKQYVKSYAKARFLKGGD